MQFFNDYAQKHGIPSGIEYQKKMEEALIAWREKRLENAAELFGQACIITPRHPAPTFYLVCTLFDLKQFALAGRLMRNECALYSSWEELPLQFNKIFPDPKNFAEKMGTLERWLAEDRRSTDSYFLFGVFSQFSGDAAKAEVAYRAILNQDPLYYEAYPFLEMIVGKKIPTPYPSWLELKEKGEAYLMEGKYDLAVSTWSLACLYTNEKSSLYFLAYSLAASGYFSQAADTLKLAITQSPEILHSQIQSQSQIAKTGLAWLTKLEKNFQKNSNIPENLFLLGYFYCVAGETHKARLAFQHLEKAKDYKDISRLFANILEGK